MAIFIFAMLIPVKVHNLASMFANKFFEHGWFCREKSHREKSREYICTVEQKKNDGLLAGNPIAYFRNKDSSCIDYPWIYIQGSVQSMLGASFVEAQRFHISKSVVFTANCFRPRVLPSVCLSHFAFSNWATLGWRRIKCVLCNFLIHIPYTYTHTHYVCIYICYV